jgi:hypothetical protein
MFRGLDFQASFRILKYYKNKGYESYKNSKSKGFIL